MDALKGDEARELLTGPLRELAEVVPMKAVLALVNDFGGTRLRVPRTIPPDGKIARSIGGSAADELSSLFPGCDIYIPRLDSLLRLARNRKIVAAYDQGATVTALARQFNLSDRTISAVLKGSGA